MTCSQVPKENALFHLLKKRRQAGGRLGLFLGADGAALAHYDGTLEAPLNQCQWLPGSGFDHPEPLAAWVAEQGLQGVSASVVLSPGDYQLMLIEAPEVEAAELREALRWRVRDLVAFDIADAIIDYFPLPEDAYRGRSRMVYVVVIADDLCRRVEAFVETVGLYLDVIDIPELALLNLMQRLPQAQGQARALLCLRSPASLINVTCDQALYLTRSIEAASSKADEAPADLILEIQRSLDYYESQIGKPPCLNLWLCPLQAEPSPLLAELRQTLAVEVVQLDLAELLSARQELPPGLQARTLFAVAGALREVRP